ncbi:MAG: hypothetical protein OHK0011_07840 [Turneriella sp.]
MQKISPFEHHLTSLSLRRASKRRLTAARNILLRNGIAWSESELLRRLAKVYLRHWRGRQLKSATARRYNRSIKGEKYVRVAWYIDRVIYSTLWQRAIHSGESVSRMLDFSIRMFLPRLMEECLRSPMPDCARARRNSTYWQERFRRRHNPQPEIFVTYQCKTEINASTGLRYVQEYKIIPKAELLALPA